MSILNPKTPKAPAVRLAGGNGAIAAKNTDEMTLRRLTMAAMLFEDNAYSSGSDNAKAVAALVPKITPETVRDIAIEARKAQKLRHMPLFIAREMCRYPAHRKHVGTVLSAICTRPDMITDFLALYQSTKRQPIAHQVKVGLGKAFNELNAYSLKKWDRQDRVFKLRDALRLVHPTPKDEAQSLIFRQLDKGELPDIVTWERILSDKGNNKAAWDELIDGNHIPALAYLRNLRNMEKAGVDPLQIKRGLDRVSSQYLLPLNFFAAAKEAPAFKGAIEDCMFRCYARQPKLLGHTVFIVDVSGSMGNKIGQKSDFLRLDAAIAMAILAAERCEFATIVATAGNDTYSRHATGIVPSARGFALEKEIRLMAEKLGGGGIFTRQCLEWAKANVKGDIDRIIVFSDSQDCDHKNHAPPAPFGKKNYIVDVSSERNGVNYAGIWDAEISGWSEEFIDFIALTEGVQSNSIKDEE